MIDPVEAYSAIAAHYDHLSRARRAYLDSVDRLIIDRIPAHASSLLDIGAGDARRTRKITAAADIANPVLLEPSPGMRLHATNTNWEQWEMRAEDLHNKDLHDNGRSFDVITCLWNVLGHITSPEKRLSTLRNLRNALAPNGLLFLDVINRYNAKAYGFGLTIARILRDRLFQNSINGDVKVRWNLGQLSVSTYGHVFTPLEMSRLINSAGLQIREQFVIDYQTGEQSSSFLKGNLFYVLERGTSDKTEAIAQTA